MEQSVNSTRARIAALIAGMSLDEKLAQLIGVWVESGASPGAEVAPLQDAMESEHLPFEEFARNGIGQITRFYGTAPVDPQRASRLLREKQRWLVEHTRTGIPAIVHEECLTGLQAWQATTFPAPLSWGASFDPVLVQEVGRAIGSTMASLGVHQGLAPVLDVVRDARWGRVEECISEDPYVVGSIGTAYVRGLQEAGIVATLKHFVGYSNSRAGRNLAPVHAGPRELADVLLPRDGEQRRAALIFWAPLLVPIAVAALTRTNLLSLWNTPSLTLLPVVLLSSPLVKLTREWAARIAALAVAVPVAVCLVSPVVAYVILEAGVENDAAYARLVMADMQEQWRKTTNKPLKLIAGPFGLISTAAFYGADRPMTFADFSPYLAPWATPARIASEGMAIACAADERGCLTAMNGLIANAPKSTKTEVVLRRHLLWFDGPPARFVIAVVPPQPH